jgi:YbbR domain-containing protein
MRFAVLENYKVKLTALVVAILFWFAVVTESNYQYDMDVRIDAVNLPEDRIIINQIAPTARVRFEGNGKSLLGLRFNEEATLEMNLENIKADTRIPLSESMLRISRRSRNVIDWHVLSPDTIFIKLAYLEKKKVPIVPQIRIETELSFVVVGKIQLSPDSVLISGPIQQVRGIERIYTESLHFENRKKDLTGSVKLLPIADSLKVSLTLQAVDYFVDIQKLLEQSFTEIPVQVINIPKNVKITPRPSTVNLTAIGGEEKLIRISEKDFQVFIDFQQKNNQNDLGYMPIIKHPPDMRIDEVIPAYIKLEIEQNSRQ